MKRTSPGFVVAAQEHDEHGNPTPNRVWLAARRRWSTDRRDAHVYRSEASARKATADTTRPTTISPIGCPRCKGDGYAGGTCPILCDHRPITATTNAPTPPTRRTQPKATPTHTQPPTVNHQRPTIAPAAPGSTTLPNNVHREARDIAEQMLGRWPRLSSGPLGVFADCGEVSPKLVGLLVAIEADDKNPRGVQDAAVWFAGYCRVRLRLNQAWPLQSWPLCLALPQPAGRAWCRPRVTAKTLLDRQRQPSLFG